MNCDFLIDGFKKYGSAPAIVYDDREYSYSELLDLYNGWLLKLQEAGFENNSVTSVRAEFCPDSIALLIALIQKNAILVPFSPPVTNPSELAEIAEAEWNIDLLAEKPSISKIGVKTANELLLRLKQASHPGLVLFSSGTTGKPKGAVHDLTFLLKKFTTPGKSMRSITFLLFDHIGGINTLFYVISSGGTLVTVKQRTPEEVCRLIEKFKVELLPTSPSFLNMILFSRAYESRDLSSLKIISYGTEPMPEITLARMTAIFPDVSFKQTYGLSEVGIMGTRSESSGSLWLKVGGQGYETKIVDGKLWIRAQSAMLGYLNAPQPFDKDGWFNTHDRVEIKDEYMKILGRETEIINVGGQKVYPVEVENALMALPGVKDAAVSGEPHVLLGEIVTAKIMVDPHNNTRDFSAGLKRELAGKLDKFKIPVKITLTEQNFTTSRFKRQR